MSSDNQSLKEVSAAADKAISGTASLPQLDTVRVHYLGKKGVVTEQLKQIGSLPHEQRKQFGQEVNQVKQTNSAIY